MQSSSLSPWSYRPTAFAKSYGNGTCMRRESCKRSDYKRKSRLVATWSSHHTTVLLMFPIKNSLTWPIVWW